MLPKSENKQQRVLVVDDNVDGREMYAEYLAHCGYSVSTADDGAEALQKARTELPDLVLMDLSLPVVDGIEATKQLKSDESTKNIKVIGLTGHMLDAPRVKAMREAGADELIARPCLPAALEDRIRKLLSRKG